METPISPSRKVRLNIVWLGSDPENRYTFQSLPLSTNVGELKTQLAIVAPGHPPPERQRLIYRGKRLVKDEDTLASILGPIPPGDNDPQFTIHLVLPLSRLPDPPTSLEEQPHNETLSRSTNNMQGRVNVPFIGGTPNVPEQQPIDPLPDMEVLRHAMNQHMEELRRHLQHNPHIHQQQHQAHQNTPSHLAHLAINGVAPLNQDPATQRQPLDIPINPQSAQTPALDPQDRNVRTQVHEHRGPGNQFHMTMRYTTTSSTHRFSSPTRSSAGQIPPLGGQPTNNQATSARSPAGHHGASPPTTTSIHQPSNPLTTIGTSNTLPAPRMEMFELVRRVFDMERQVSRDDFPSTSEVLQLYSDLDQYNRNPDTQNMRIGRVVVGTYLRNQLDSISARQLDAIRTGRVHPDGSRSTVAYSAHGAHAAPLPQIPRNGDDGQGSQVYLLSSPSGPHGLVFSNGTVFSTAPHSSRFSPSTIGGVAPDMREEIPQVPDQRDQNAPVRERDNNAANAPVNAALQAGQAGRGHDRHQDQFNANLRAIGGAVFLLVRLGVFVWFFSGGSWLTTLMLAAVSFVIFLGHVGLFAPFREMPIWRHLEGLVPLAPAAPANRQMPNGAAGQVDDTPTAQRGDLPEPQQVAERLMQERRERGGHWIQDRLQRAERAAAIFLASLVPGVGERYIRARNDAEVARQSEERARLERERQSASDATDGSSTSPVAAGSSEQNSSAEGVADSERVADPQTRPETEAQA